MFARARAAALWLARRDALARGFAAQGADRPLHESVVALQRYEHTTTDKLLNVLRSSQVVLHCEAACATRWHRERCRRAPRERNVVQRRRLHVLQRHAVFDERRRDVFKDALDDGEAPRAMVRIDAARCPALAARRGRNKAERKDAGLLLARIAHVFLFLLPSVNSFFSFPTPSFFGVHARAAMIATTTQQTIHTFR